MNEPKECQRCARLQRLLEIEQDKDRLGNESLAGHLRMAQGNIAHLKHQLSMQTDALLMNIAEGIAFDCGVEWKEITRAYDAIDTSKKDDVRSKLFEVMRLIAKDGGFE